MVADGSRNILYGSTGTIGPVKESEYSDTGSFDIGASVLLDEVHSLKSAGDFDFDLISLLLGVDEIESVSDVQSFSLVILGYDKCGNQIAYMGRSLLAFPGTGGYITEIDAGMFGELNFFGLRTVQL